MDTNHRYSPTIWPVFIGLVAALLFGLALMRAFTPLSAAGEVGYPIAPMLDRAPNIPSPSPLASPPYPAPWTPGPDVLPGTVPPQYLHLCDEWYSYRADLSLQGEKQVMAEQAYQDCVAAFGATLPPPAVATAKAQSPTQLPNITPAPTIAFEDIYPARAAGAGTIVENLGLSQYLFHSEYYPIQNSWHIDTGGIRTVVFAGARRDEHSGATSQGMVAVIIVPLNGDQMDAGNTQGEVYLTPGAVGAVRIVDANGMMLTLATESGEGFFFNAASHQFIFPGPPSPVSRTAGSGTIVESTSSTESYLFENRWYKETAGMRLVVYAGSERQDQDQGVVLVGVTSADQPDILQETVVYRTPFAMGPVRIVQVEDGRLTLVPRYGLKFVFDVDLRQFVEWPEVAPADLLTATAQARPVNIGSIAVSTAPAPAEVVAP